VAGGCVAGVYAEALYRLARETNAVDAVSADLAVVRGALRDVERLRPLVETPQMGDETREQMIRAALGDLVGKPVLHLLLLVVRKRRQGSIEAIIDAYQALIEEARGERRATLTTAAPLDEAERARIAGALSSKTGARILLDARVDPSLLGGVRLRLGDTLVDGTIKTALDRLARAMEGANHGPP
jgi:F-type H+-transporting ATPase subunit delta